VGISDNAAPRRRFPRDPVAAANAILDRGYGKPQQSIDMMLMTKRLAEMTEAELVELNSKLIAAGAIESTERPANEELH
jgi:hypothetical protein